MKLEAVLSLLDRIAPFSYAMPWDNSGLQVGDPQREISSILVALELTRSVLEEALDLGVQLIVTHHPLIFSPLQSLILNRYPGSLLARLIKKDLALVAMHTNWDCAPGGLSHALASLLSLEVDGVLEASPREGGGIGRVGRLPRPQTLEALLEKLMEALPAPWARLVGDPQREVTRVAVCPGSGGDLWTRARDMKAQVLVTGDVKHHQAREALEEGMAILDLGHFATEAWGMAILAQRVKEEMPPLSVSLEGSLEDPFLIYTRGGPP